MGLCPATCVPAVFEAGSFGWRRAEEAGGPDSETGPNHRGKGPPINVRTGMNRRESAISHR
jgi:hypothetical protein